MARKLKWEAAAWSEDSSSDERIAVTNFGGAKSLVLLVAGSVVEASDRDHIWVERIVGQVYHKTTATVVAGALPCNIKERICVGHSFEPGDSPGPTDTSDPWSREHAGVDNFLWERTQLVIARDAATTVTGEYFDINGGVPFWSVIDVRVGRLLRPTNFLAYTVQTDPANGGPAGAVCQTWGWLRILMSE